jgi:hypothetical protein
VSSWFLVWCWWLLKCLHIMHYAFEVRLLVVNLLSTKFLVYYRWFTKSQFSRVYILLYHVKLKSSILIIVVVLLWPTLFLLCRMICVAVNPYHDVYYFFLFTGVDVNSTIIFLFTSTNFVLFNYDDIMVYWYWSSMYPSGGDY